MSLPRQLFAWELLDLCETLRARSSSTVRVVLSADAPSEWLDGWSEILAEAVIGRIEVQFASGRRRGKSVTGEGQLEVRFGESLHHRRG
jgi:hypothetical protein